LSRCQLRRVKLLPSAFCGCSAFLRQSRGPSARCSAAGFFLVDATLPAQQALADWTDAYGGAADLL